MTWTRQRRALKRLERETAPYRQQRLEADLEAFYRSGDECFVESSRLLGGHSGRITELTPGEWVVVSGTGVTASIPWKSITGVRSWPPEPRPDRFAAARAEFGTYTDGA